MSQCAGKRYTAQTKHLEILPMFGEIFKVNTHESDCKCIENIEKTPIEG
jgi:hypothetical protein